MFKFTKKSIIAAALASSLCAGATFAGTEAKNVILMISDGIGFNGWEAAKYYEGSLPYDNNDFNFYGMSNYMLNVKDNDTGEMINPAGIDAAGKNWTGIEQGYDAGQFWSDFNYNRGTHANDYFYFTDSAAAATAMYTGQKTYGNAVSYGVDGTDIPTFFEFAAMNGKAAGAVSSVQFNHATPAAVYAHAYYRYNKTEIACEGIASNMTVIMGGDGYIDSDGEYPGSTAGWLTDAAAAGFATVDESSPAGMDYDALANGTYTPAKLAAVFDGSTLDGRTAPTLETMTKGALNVLAQNPNGMAVMIEGGAIDWQNHANNADLMMREQVDFDNSVQTVIDWVNDPSNGSSWDDTLLIVTSDHETGGIWGEGQIVDDNGTPNDFTDDTINTTWQNVTDNGVGNLPGMSYTSGGHTNTIVPMWTRGAGADKFAALVDGNDAQAALFWDEFGGTNGWNGDYIDNTDIFTVMMDASNVPEPTTALAMVIAGLAAITRRTR